MFGRANLASVLVTVALVASASAQFGNVFEQFMGGQQQQQHHRVSADICQWYYLSIFPSLCIKGYNANTSQLTVPITFAQGHYVSFSDFQISICQTLTYAL
jgi:hypothetical protein